MEQETKLLLFDIGGVFVQLTGVAQMLAWTEGIHTEPELWKLWTESKAVKKFETGLIPPDVFGQTLVDEFSLPVDAPTFLSAFTKWTTRPYPGCQEVMECLNGNHMTASLSNTNELHWNNLCESIHIDALFQHNFPSHKLGRIKPDPMAFCHVLETLKISAAETLFFDDTQANIDAARALGIESHRVCGVDHLTHTLKELDLL